MDAFSQGFVKSAGLLRMGMKALPYAAGGAGALWAGSQISPEFGKAVGQLGSDIRKKYLDTVYPLTQSDGPKPLAEGPTLTAADRLGPRPLAQGPTNEAAAALPKPTASGPTLERSSALLKRGMIPLAKKSSVSCTCRPKIPATPQSSIRCPRFQLFLSLSSAASCIAMDLAVKYWRTSPLQSASEWATLPKAFVVISAKE